MTKRDEDVAIITITSLIIAIVSFMSNLYFHYWITDIVLVLSSITALGGFLYGTRDRTE